MTMLEPEHAHHALGMRPARVLPFGPINAASTLLVQGAGLFVGGAGEETTGAASARLLISDGGNVAAAAWSIPYTLAAAESRLDMPSAHGLIFERGLLVTATAGTIAGVLFVVLLTGDELDALTTLRRPFNR